MENDISQLDSSIAAILETLPPVWDRIRSNLRFAATNKFGITLDQFHTLRHIRKGYAHVGELAEKRQVSRSAISQSIVALEAKGLIARRQESGDRRLVKLELTEFAARVLDENYEENRLWMKSRMKSLPASELLLIEDAMKALGAIFARDGK